MNHKNLSKWKTRPSQCARISRCLALPMIAIAALFAFSAGVPSSFASNSGKTVAVANGGAGGAGSAAMAGIGALGMLMGTDRGSRKFFAADKGGDGGAAEALDTIKKHIGKLRGRANDALSRLKPLEQHEHANEMGYLFRAMEDAHGQLSGIMDHIEEGVLPQYEAAMQSAQQAALKDPKFIQGVIDDAVKNGALVTKADAEGRVQTAQQSAYDKAKGELTVAAEKQTKLGARRGEAVGVIAGLLKTDKTDGVAQATEVCSKLSDDALLGDNYKDAIQGAATRIKKCGELGVTAVGTLQEVCSMEAPAYESQVKTWEEVAKASRGSGPRLHPFAGIGSSATATERQSSSAEKRKSVIC